MYAQPIWLGLANTKEIKCQNSHCDDHLRLASATGETVSLPFDDPNEHLNVAFNISQNGMYLSLDSLGVISDAIQGSAVAVCQLDCDNTSSEYITILCR